MTFDGKNFLIGVLVGAAAVTLMKTDSFRKGCSKVLAAGMKRKEESSEFLESVKEDVEDAAAENKAKALKA